MRTAITQARRSGAFVGLKDLVRPQQLPSLAAWYDISDLSSLIYDGSNRVALVSDKSGNSAVNCLVLNGASGNTASVSDAAQFTNGDIDIRLDLLANDYTPSSAQVLKAKRIVGSGQASWQFVLNTTGTLQVTYSTNGSTLVDMVSTASLTTTNLTRIQLRVVLDVDNGAGGKTARFYTRAAGTSLNVATGWTQLGADVTTAGTITLFDGTDSVYTGGLGGASSNNFSGLIYESWFSNTIDSTTAGLDEDFSSAGKLAASFTCSTGQTVTINSTGETGARISGARDLYQGVDNNKPVLTINVAGNYLTLDGTNDFLKSPAFSLPQPASVYFVGSQISWTVLDYIFNGNASSDTYFRQVTSSPNVVQGQAATVGTELTAWPVGATAIITNIFNGASGLLRLNRNTSVAGANDTRAMNGLTLGSRGDGGANWGNITASEILIYSAAQGLSFQDRVIIWLGRKWKILV